jgi:anti-sigma factor RsiW
MNAVDRNAMEHDEAANLLPWFVNGTLPNAEREQVERHVHDCLACRAELREQQALRMLVQRHPDVHLSAEQGFALLARQIDVGAEAAPRRVGDEPAARDAAAARAARLFRFVRRAGAFAGGHRLVLANAAALALIAGVAVWLAAGGPADEPAYSTLTQPQSLEGAQLDIVFAPGTTQAAMHEVLGEIDGTIVGGPSDVGRYTVRLERSPSDAELDDVIGRLLADPRVRFAGRAFIGPQGP